MGARAPDSRPRCPGLRACHRRPLMPTYHDPLQDAGEASEALRGLAHA
ncbi:hypothetical protein GUG48_24760, partial [Xanthomonas citri pv. citri]|nr:hypothetical protein [Xanthomonas citri pv. citri]